MDAIGPLHYSTYQTSANAAAAISLQFDIDYDLTDASNPYEGRLVYEPYQSATVLQNVWQNWDPIPGLWYGTRATVTVGDAPVANPCQQATPCTWQQVLALYPNAGMRNPGALLFKAGGPVGFNFDGNVDAFTLGIGTSVNTINFEPNTANNKTAGDNQGTLINTAFPINLQVTVTDGVTGIANVPVTFTAPSSGASGTFAGGCLTVTVITDANGVATAPQFTANGQAGYYIVTATSPGIPTANFNLRNMLSPTAADSRISGRVVRNDGSPIAGTVIELTGSQTRKTITNSLGSYRFDNVETGGFYTVTPSLLNYSFGPDKLSFSQIGNTTEAVFTGTPEVATVVNMIETPEFFVRQHYIDFLGREPDEGGLNFWSDQILSCGSDADCVERRTINVSAAYFLSIEFQRTGGLVDGLYRATFGRKPHYAEFVPDAGTIAQNVVVGRAGWEAQLKENSESFANAFVQRPEFRVAFDGLSNPEYVDRLIGNTRVAFSTDERDALVADLAANRLTRAAVLLRIAEDERFVSAKRNEAFVMMQYFGYLRRDPDTSGYDFWLTKLNSFGGNFEQAEMVKAFIRSTEYRSRFQR